MKNGWQTVAEQLRNEMGEYGQLLTLFEEQHRQILGNAPRGALASAHQIEAQVRRLDLERRRREDAVAAFAANHGQPASSTLLSLLPFATVEARPLLKALITEINLLIHRVRRDGRRNQRLLGCVVECHQEILRRLRPDAFTKTYAWDGRVSLASTEPAPMIKTAG